jgi:hypothetical protein
MPIRTEQGGAAALAALDIKTQEAGRPHELVDPSKVTRDRCR